jgi:hypothetical protein
MAATTWHRAIPEDDRRLPIGSFDAVDGQIWQTGNHQLSCAGRPARPASEREVLKPLHRIQYSLSDRRCGNRIGGSDPSNNAEESSFAGWVQRIVMDGV